MTGSDVDSVMPAGDPMVGSKDTVYSWEEVKKHCEKSSRWIVIDDHVYDVTSWSKKHPGGHIVLGHFAGQDASEAFRAFHHNRLDYVRKFLKPLRIGRVEPRPADKNFNIKKDFENLRQTAEKMGLFNSSFWFFALNLAHILAIDIASYLVLVYYGNGWLPFFASVLLMATAQCQLGWNQHDAGHLSVFKSSSWNHVYHMLLFPILHGTSAKWWNHMHYQHHSKPNVINKDPDVRLEAFFVLGEEIPVTKAKSQEKITMPYHNQHKYFSIIMPPLLYPVYFQIMNFRHVYTRKLWLEAALMSVYHIRVYLMYKPLIGGLGLLLWYELMRIVEGTWFTWVSQSNHIPMPVESEDPEDIAWLKNQMPRHNYYKVAPLVKSLCLKHGIDYKVKPMLEAFKDIILSLKKSGELWLHTYQEFHST